MNKINKIEALRGFAAIYVLIHHFNIGEGSWLKYFAQQGQVAVIMFFIISGFVINISNREKIHSNKINFSTYFKKRFRRIYPVLFVSLIIAYLTASLAELKFISFDWKSFIANILNFQDLARHPGYWVEAFAGNTPLWSLSYEWWFYMLFFPLVKYVKFSSQRFIAISISLLGFLTYSIFPNQISIICEYFVIWWSGVELAEAWKQKSRLKFKDLIIICSSLIGLLILQVIRIIFFQGDKSLSYYPLINAIHTSFAIGLIVLGYIWYRFKFFGFNSTFGYFSFFGPISYSIYLFHYPLIMKYEFSFFQSLLVQYLIMSLILYILCNLIEVKLQFVINKYIN